MRNSKALSLFFQTFVLGAVAFGVAGCWKAKKAAPDYSGDENTATFVVFSGRVEYQPSDTVTAVWKIPTADTYVFVACLRDRALRQPVFRQEFEITGDGDKIYTRTTDDQGCLNWSETLPFNYFAEDPTWILFDRRIRATRRAAMLGDRPVYYAINPWLPYRGERARNAEWISDEKALNAFSRRRLVRGEAQIRAALTGDLRQSAPLIATDLKLHVTQVADHLTRPLKPPGEVLALGEPEPDTRGVELEMDLEFKPSILLRDFRGIEYPLPLRAGKFRIFAHVVAINQGRDSLQGTILTPYVPSKVAEFDPRDGKVGVTLRTVLTREVTRGRLMLVLKVMPVFGEGEGAAATARMKPFESIYLLGHYNELLQQRSPIIRDRDRTEFPRGFDFDAYLANLRANDRRLLEAGYIHRSRPFEFGIMDIRWLGIQPGETATRRTVEYRARTCVINALTGREVARSWFEVRVAGGPPERIQSDEAGCIPFTGTITHDYYKPEDYFLQEVEITEEASQYSEKLTAAINPWDDKFTFGTDTRTLRPEFLTRIRERRKPPSRFFLPGFQYQTLRFLYEIDEFMNLQVKKTVLMLLDPRVVRYSSIVLGRNATEKLRDGIWLMKVALQKDYLDPAAKGVNLEATQVPLRHPETREIVKDRRTGRPVMVPAFRPSKGKEPTRQYITVETKLVRVQDGRIITPVTFSMRDLRLMRIRKFFLVQFEPVNENMLANFNLIEQSEREKLDRMLGEVERDRAARRETMGGVGEPEDGTNQPSREAQQMRAHYMRSDSVQSRLREGITRLQNAFRSVRDSNGAIETDAQLQSIYRDFNVTPQQLETLKEVDFTLIPINPMVDLNTLIDHDSGLEKRTFVGPLTLINNTNSSNMIPTDVIETCQGVGDCHWVRGAIDGQLPADNSAYENSPYYGSLNHLKGAQVDDLIREERRLQQQYYIQSKLNAQIHQYIQDFNLNFVSVKSDERLHKVKDNCEGVQLFGPEEALTREEMDRRVNECLERASGRQWESDRFLEIANQGLSGVDLLTKDGLSQMVKTGEVPRNMALRLCRAMITIIQDGARRPPHSDPRLAQAQMNTQFFEANGRRELLGRCLADVSENPSRVFTVDQRIRVKQTGRYRFKGGKSLNFNVGANVAVSLSASTSLHTNFDLLSLLPMFPYKPKLNINADMRRSTSETTNINESTFLVMQAATFDIELLRYERCAIVRIGPRWSGLGALFRNNREEELGVREQFRRRALQASGFMFCTGEDETAPLPIRERYYYFTQHFTEGDMLDQGDIYNHPWLLGLRGVRDMRTFLYLLHKQPGASFWSVFDPRYYLGLRKNENWAFERLEYAYERILPTFPSLYTVIPAREETDECVVDYPHDCAPALSFTDGDRARGGEALDLRGRVGDGIPDPIREQIHVPNEQLRERFKGFDDQLLEPQRRQ